MEAIARLGARAGLDPATPEGLFQMRDDVGELVAKWCKARPLAEIAEQLDAAGVCWGPYQTFGQMLAEDVRCTAQNAIFETIDQANVGPMLAPGSPLDFHGLDRLPVAGAPALGEHTDEILAGVLDLTDVQIGRLHDQRIVDGPVPS